jgi:hypothetical protein
LAGLVGAAAAVYAIIAFGVLPADVFYSGDAGVKYIQLGSLVRQHLRTLALAYPAADLDPAGALFPVEPPFAWRVGDRFLSGFDPAFPALSVPAFVALGLPGLRVLPVIAAVLLLAVLGALAVAAGASRRGALAAVGLVAFASPLPFYAVQFWEHTTVTLLTTIAVLLALKASAGAGARHAFGAGAVLGSSAAIRADAYVCALALAVALLAVRGPGCRRALGALAGGLAGPLVLLWSFNLGTSGHALGLHVLPVLSPDVPLGDLPSLRLGRLVRLLIAGENALILHCPYLLLAAAAPLWTRGSAPPPVRFLRVVFVVATLGIALAVPNDGGLQWGPRYFLPVIPIGAVLVVQALSAGQDGDPATREGRHDGVRRSRRRARRRVGDRARRRGPIFLWVGALLVLVGAVGAVLGVVRLYERLVHVEAPALATLRRLTPTTLVLRNPWFAQGLAASYFDVPMVYARRDDEVAEVARRLWSAGRTGFVMADWSALPPSPATMHLADGPGSSVQIRQQSAFVSGPYRFEAWRIEPR